MTFRLSSYFRQRREALGLGRGRLSVLAGYKDPSRGARRIHEFEEQGVIHTDLLAKLMKVLGVDQGTVDRLLEEDRREGFRRWNHWANQPMRSFVGIRSLLRVEWIDGGLGGIRLTEEAVHQPYLKDYDVLGETPLTWGRRWDTSKWGIFVARDSGEPVGGAVVAWKTPGLHMLEGRDDIAVLWDLRVRTDRRQQGVGKELMNQAASWARERQCRALKIETQNNNVSACRFYAACGCRLCGVHPGAYAELPEEVMLLWNLDLR